MVRNRHTLHFHDAEQGSEDWYRARRGRVTGSKCAPLLADPGKGRDGLSVGCWTLVYSLAADIIRGHDHPVDPSGSYESSAMARGSRLEPHARRAYALAEFEIVREVGFCEVVGRLAGFSADLLVGRADEPLTKGAEIKCLELKAHLAAIDDDKIKPEHLAQIEWSMFCGGLTSWDLVHFSPELDRDRGGLHVETFTPDPVKQERFAEALPLVEKAVWRVVEKYGPPGAMEGLTLQPVREHP